MRRRLTAGLLLCLFLWTCAAGCGARTEPTQTDALTEPGPTAVLTEPGPTAGSTEPEPIAVLTELEPTDVPTETVSSVPETTEAEPAPVEGMLMKMTLEEKIAQMLVVTPEALTGGENSVTKTDETLRAAFDRIPVGGILLMSGNLRNPAQTRTLLSGLREISAGRTGLPLLLCVDEEGGTVARIGGNAAFGVPRIPSMSKVGDAETARALGRTMGAYLRDLGFNADFAPDADVLTNPENRVVRDRSFGSDPELVTELAEALAQGLQEAGILPCWKHFPGHGGTAEDSHKGFAVLHLDQEDPERSPELQPFLRAVDAGAPMIMTGHITVPELDPELPASLSPALLSLLRGPARRYEGLLITDALSMGAIKSRFGTGEAAVLAVEAGNDLLLVTDKAETAWRAVLEAVRDGRIPEERIDESVRRILNMKNGLP